MKKRKRKRLNKTYTKKLTRNMLVIGTISGNIPYLLSALEREPVSELGQVWVLGIVAVCIGYLVRGFKDSKETSDDEYRRMLLDNVGG